MGGKTLLFLVAKLSPFPQNTIILSDRRRSPLRRRSGFEMESVFLKMRGERPLSRVSTGKLSLSRRSQLLTAPTEPAAAVQQLHDPEESVRKPTSFITVCLF